jgi:hypothetical protein
MPKQAMNYQNNIIYKIQHKTIYELIYIGSTTNFAKRKCAHKIRCYNENIPGYNEKKYVMIRENGGWDMFDMVLVKKYPCNDALEAYTEEERIRRELNANMNSIRCFATQEELKQNKIKYRELHKEHNKVTSKKYYETHKEELKKYYESHKEQKKVNAKKYQETHVEEIALKKKQYREKNNQKVECECGCFISNLNISTHKKTPKHQKLLSAKLLK